MKIDCVFSGGGVKAYAFIGALKALTQQYCLERVAGSSAGAIIAAFLAANYKVAEIELLFKQIDLKKFLDPPLLSQKIPFGKWIFLYFTMGLYKGNAFEKWFHRILLEKGVETFNDIKEGSLKIVVSDVSLGRMIVIPDDLQDVYGIKPHQFKIATAVRMSASFPYFFMPKIIQNQQRKQSVIVDGGLLSNFPLWVLQKDGKRPVLGMTLSESTDNYKATTIKNSLDLLNAIFHAMLKAHDAKYVSEAKDGNILFIPVNNIKSTDLLISNDDKEALITLGKDEMTEFLRRWPM